MNIKTFLIAIFTSLILPQGISQKIIKGELLLRNTDGKNQKIENSVPKSGVLVVSLSEDAKSKKDSLSLSCSGCGMTIAPEGWLYTAYVTSTITITLSMILEGEIVVLWQRRLKIE